jgi:hypothetical protein
MSKGKKAGQTSALCLVGIYRKRRIVPAARVRHMVSTATYCTPIPGIHDVEHQWCVHCNGGVQTRWRLPGTIAHPSHIFMLYTRRLQGDPPPITGNDMSRIGHSRDLYLQSFNRRINVTHCTTSTSFFT